MDKRPLTTQTILRAQRQAIGLDNGSNSAKAVELAGKGPQCCAEIRGKQVDAVQAVACAAQLLAEATSPAVAGLCCLTMQSCAMAVRLAQQVQGKIISAKAAWASMQTLPADKTVFSVATPPMPVVSFHSSLERAMQSDLLLWIGHTDKDHPIAAMLGSVRKHIICKADRPCRPTTGETPVLPEVFGRSLGQHVKAHLHLSENLQDMTALRLALRGQVDASQQVSQQGHAHVHAEALRWADRLFKAKCATLVVSPGIADGRLISQCHLLAAQIQKQVRTSVLHLPRLDALNQRGAAEVCTWLTGLNPGRHIIDFSASSGQQLNATSSGDPSFDVLLHFADQPSPLPLPTEHPSVPFITVGPVANPHAQVSFVTGGLTDAIAGHVMCFDGHMLGVCPDAQLAQEDPTLLLLKQIINQTRPNEP